MIKGDLYCKNCFVRLFKEKGNYAVFGDKTLPKSRTSVSEAKSSPPKESSPMDQAGSVEPAREPVAVVEPVPEPVVEPVPEPVVEPVPEPVVEPVPEPVVEPVPEPVVEPVPEPVVEPVVMADEQAPQPDEQQAMQQDEQADPFANIQAV